MIVIYFFKCVLEIDTVTDVKVFTDKITHLGLSENVCGGE